MPLVILRPHLMQGGPRESIDSPLESKPTRSLGEGEGNGEGVAWALECPTASLVSGVAALFPRGKPDVESGSQERTKACHGAAVDEPKRLFRDNPEIETREPWWYARSHRSNDTQDHSTDCHWLETALVAFHKPEEVSTGSSATCVRSNLSLLQFHRKDLDRLQWDIIVVSA